jgi:Predicted permeases
MLANLSDYQKAVFMVVLAGACLSTLGIGTRLMESATGLQVVFFRSIGTATAMLIFLVWRYRAQTISRFTSIGSVGVAAIFCLCGASIFIVLAVSYTSVANAMFIISLAPLVAGLFAWLLIGEKVSKATLIASGIALSGVLIIVQGALTTDGLLGIGFAFLMLICYGSFSVCLRIGKDIDMLPCVALHAIALFIGLGLTMPLLGISMTIPLNDILICLALGVFQLALGTTLLTLGARHVPAAQLTLLAMLEIVLNPIWVWLGVGEVPTNSSLIGGAIILSAISFQAVNAIKTESD